MKKICLIVCVMVMAAAMAAADDVEMNFSGEVKTGVLWEQKEKPGTKTSNKTGMGNNDDAGTPGRIRLDGELTKDTIGFKMRWETNDYIGATPIRPRWAYAYAYGDFIDEQLRLSGGMLGQSPWSTGGYEIWNELDNLAGLRVEVKPYVLEGLNVGFVLNTFNVEGDNTNQTLLGLLAETIVGASYTHEYFHIRAAWRFDSEEDNRFSSGNALSDGYELVYRVEERALRNVVDGLAIWANGRLVGIMAEDTDMTNYVNWLYIQYAPSAFPLDAQLRTGLDTDKGGDKWFFKLKPVITYGITDFLRLGLIFRYEKDFGEASWAKDRAYKLIAFQPLIRVVFTSMYVDLAYQFSREYETAADTITQINWVNLRFVYTF